MVSSSLTSPVWWLEPWLNSCTWFYHMKTQTIYFEQVCLWKSGPCKPDCLAANLYSVLIISWHDVYVNYAVLGALSSAYLQFWTRDIFVELQWTRWNWELISSGISQPLNKYWYDAHWWAERKEAPNTISFIYTVCCDTIRIQKCNCSQQYRYRRMEPQARSTPARILCFSIQSR